MRSRNEQQDQIESSTHRELELLSAVEDNPLVTQRQLSRRVGIALGLTNLVLRNLMQKGYVRATKAGWKRWFYSLTPDGFSYKIRLTVSYIHRVLAHYQNVRQSLREQLRPLALNEESRVAMCGTGEFAELVYLALREIGIEEVEVFGPAPLGGSRFLGMRVLDIATLRPQDYDRVVVADLEGPNRFQAQFQDGSLAPGNLVTFFEDYQAREEVSWR